ncbi:MAG: hypothetical protein WA896_22410 [Spirulinaceae cyanobacterium]
MLSGKAKTLFIQAGFFLLTLLLGGIQAWNHRYNLSTGDAVSYLDIGDAYWRGNFSAAINDYFSPLYCWILGFFIKVISPGIYWEFLTVKIANLFILSCGFLAFSFFLKEFIYYYEAKVNQGETKKYLQIPQWIWLILGYSLFIWSSLQWIGVDNDTPDMCVATITYLAAGLILKIYTRSDSWYNFLFLGVTLGVGYLAKAIMFPMALIFLGTCFFCIGSLRRTWGRIILATLIFIVVAGPFIFAISQKSGSFTFGSAGKLNYAWNISHNIGGHHWQGKPSGSGTPQHPTRVIFAEPTVYEFATPIAGTYPPWHDPSYWNAGLQPKPNLPRQIAEVVSHSWEYYQIFGKYLLFGYLIFIIASGNFWVQGRELLKNWPLYIPACAGLGALLLVHVRPRLIASFVVLLFAAVFGSLRLPNNPQVKRFVIGITLGVCLLTLSSLSNISDIAGEPIHWKIAQGLEKLGVTNGEQIAILGKYGDGSSYYWARLAKVKIVVEIPEIASFWDADSTTQKQIYQEVKDAGAKLIVQEVGTKPSEDSNWQQISNTNCYLHFLTKPQNLES